jgi:geranylgeranyl diphosphate synthase, type II
LARRIHDGPAGERKIHIVPTGDTMTVFTVQYDCYRSLVEVALPDYLPAAARETGGLPVEAARYSLLGGGKRIRPILLLAVCDLLSAETARAMPFACALEMIHTYSLIHDDLPAMDNDDLRRGRPTCHKIYGEAIAILAGDLLLNRAYEILLQAVQPRTRGSIAAARQIAAAAGGSGMISGQALDLANAGQTVSLEQLQLMHKLKTGALLKAPVIAAVSLAGAGSETRRWLVQYAEAIGLAFQIQDDILDVTGSTAALGKSAGKDRRDEKATYVNMLGLDEARRQLALTAGNSRSALEQLKKCELNTSFLEELTEYMLRRGN